MKKSENEVVFEKDDCPFCNGSGTVNPPPEYRSKKCDHLVPQRYLHSLIVSSELGIETSQKLLARSVEKKISCELLLKKYFF